MSKVGGLLVIVSGIIIFLIGSAFLFGIIMDNTIMLIAGPFLIVAIILMGIGVFLMVKGAQMYNKKRIHI